MKNRLGRTPAQRFLAMVSKDESGCWIWTGHRDPLGYGRFYFKKKRHLAHRAAWELFVAQPVNHICHSCDVPACVNPDHLRDASQSENLVDMVIRNRRTYRLNAEKVASIRSLRASGTTYRSIAKTVGCSKSSVYEVCKGIHWSCL